MFEIFLGLISVKDNNSDIVDTNLLNQNIDIKKNSVHIKCLTLTGVNIKSTCPGSRVVTVKVHLLSNHTGRQTENKFCNLHKIRYLI